MNQEKQRIADIRRRLEQMKLERDRQNREFEPLERAVAPADLKVAEEVLRDARRERAPSLMFNPGLRA
jgi:hypothetical protein